MIKHFLLNLFGGQNVSQNGNFCLYFENSREGPILRLQIGGGGGGGQPAQILGRYVLR